MKFPAESSDLTRGTNTVNTINPVILGAAPNLVSNGFPR